MADLYSSGFNRFLYKSSAPDVGDLPVGTGVGGMGGLQGDVSSPSMYSLISDGTPAASLLAGSIDQQIFSKKTSFTDTTEGWRQGIDKDGHYKWIIGNATNSADFSVTTIGVFTVKGALVASSIDIPDMVTPDIGFHVDVMGNTWWGKNVAQGLAAAPASVTKAGVAKFISGSIGGWTLSATTLTGTGVTMTSGAGASISFGTVPPTSPILGTGIFIDKTGLFGLSANTQNFKIDATNGNITSIAGLIGGWTINSTQLTATGIILDSAAQTITVGSAVPSIVIDGINKWITTSTYTSGSQGWRILQDGTADFNNIFARGEFHTQVLSYGSVHVTAGSTLLALSGGKLKADFTSAAGVGANTIDINDPPTGHVQVFVVSDILRIKDGSGNDNWFTITAVSDQATFFRYTATKQSGAIATFRAGAAVADYGQSGQGLIYSTVDGINAPYIAVQTHAGSPWTTITTQLRLGNLNGYLDYASNIYGFAVGDSSGTNPNITIETTNGIRIRNGTTALISFSGGTALIAGWTISTTTLANSTNIILDSSNKAISINSATFGALGIQLQYNAGTPRASIGDGASQYLKFDGTNISWSSANTTLDTAGKLTTTSASIAAFTIAATTISATNLTLTSGAANTANISVGTGANLGGLNSAAAAGDIIFWGGDTFANRATASFRVTAAGAVTATSFTANVAGNVAGWTISSTTLANGTNIILDASNKAISINDSTFGNKGVQLQYNAGTPRAYIGDGVNQFFKFDGTNISWKTPNSSLDTAGNFTTVAGTIGGSTVTGTTFAATNLTWTSGAANTANITGGTGATAGGINSAGASTDVFLWGGATFANRATAPYRILADGSELGNAFLKTTTAVTVASTVAETNVISVSVPGGTMGTTGVLKAYVWFNAWGSLMAGDSVTFRFKYGATTIATVTIATNGNGQKALALIHLLSDAGTGAQKGDMSIFKYVTASTLDGRDGTAAEDSTAAKSFIVTVQHSRNDAANSITMDRYVIEKV